jgi:cell division protein FtsN
MKKIIIPALTVSLIVGGLYAGANISAFGFGNRDMAGTLADKLGKSPDEVETAFDAMRQEHQASMQSEYETKLDEAVKAGELTADQKQLLIQKHTEIQAKHEAQMQQRWQERQDLEAWAESNGIDTQYLFGFGGQGKGMGMHGGRGMMRGAH